MTATNPTTLTPEHDITLTDPDGGVLHFILCDSKGKRVLDDEVGKALSVNPLAQSALQTFEGGSKYSDKILPYQSTEQTDWTGGRGSNDYENDTTRFFDNYRTQITSRGVILGGAEHYSTGLVAGDLATEAPQNIKFTALYDTTRYVACSFVASSSYSAAVFYVYLKYIGTPQPLTLEIWTNSSGSPAALVGTATVSVGTGDVDWEGVISEKFRCALTTPQAITSGTTYHFVARTDSADSITSHWLIGCNTGGKASTAGVTWSGSASLYRNPWFRINAAETPGKTIFFDYKGAKYCVLSPDSGADSTLWLLGDRGLADSNAGDKTYLEDATKNWTVDEWIGKYVYIYSGPGSEETVPLRLIVANDANSLEVETDWIRTHTTDTAYVILGSNKWKQVNDTDLNGTPEDLDGNVTDVAIANEFVYFARGDSSSKNILRYLWYNSGGVASESCVADVVMARQLISIRHPDDDQFTLYGSIHEHWHYGNAVWKARVPKYWGDLYTDLGELMPAGKPFDNAAITYATNSKEYGGAKVSVTADFGTVLAASYNLSAALDITKAEKIGFIFLTDVQNDGNDLQVGYSATDAMGGTPVYADMSFFYASVPGWGTATINPLGADARAVKSVGFKITFDRGAQNVWFLEGMRLIGSPTYIELPKSERINRLIAYSGNQTDPRENPWVITEGNVYEIQTQNGDAVVPIPIKEMAALKNYQTGNAAAVNDVYLYFNLYRKIERYFGRNLDDIGPDRDEGLPWNRRGDICFMLSYPGRVIVGIDAGSEGYSSVYVLNGNGWHELYRGAEGERIRSGGLLSMPDTSTSRLYLGLDSGPLWIPLSVDPFSDNNFPYTFEGTIESAWVYTNLKSVSKAWKSITLFQDNTEVFQRVAHGTSTTIGTYVDYLVDAGLSWNPIAESNGTAYLFDAYPKEEHNFSPSSPPNVTGYRIKYRLRIQSNSANKTPLVISTVIDSYCIIPVKYAYSFTCMIAENYNQKKLGDGGDDLALGTYANVETAYARILTLSNAVTPMWWESRFSWCDSKTVVLQPPPTVPLYVHSASQEEALLMQLTCHDI